MRIGPPGHGFGGLGCNVVRVLAEGQVALPGTERAPHGTHRVDGRQIGRRNDHVTVVGKVLARLLDCLVGVLHAFQVQQPRLQRRQRVHHSRVNAVDLTLVDASASGLLQGAGHQSLDGRQVLIEAGGGGQSCGVSFLLSRNQPVFLPDAVDRRINNGPRHQHDQHHGQNKQQENGQHAALAAHGGQAADAVSTPGAECHLMAPAGSSSVHKSGGMLAT